MHIRMYYCEMVRVMCDVIYAILDIVSGIVTVLAINMRSEYVHAAW